MRLSAGSRLGSYEILAALGAGGMGEVYRARDTKLGRDVAIKILPDGFAQDSERLARLRREAQVLAALNHPHIAAIYDLQDVDGQQFLVLELIDGETLADRIAKGPLPLDEVLAIARQIAEALEAAHERGIVHRDLKPANIAVTADDRVKVLDFGLARPATVASADTRDLVDSPTITSPAALTEAGLILGTAAYMSPEQAKGRAADKRSDMWAFGAVLFEMVTGRRTFAGDGVSDTIAAVLRAEPDWSALPPHLPPSIVALIQGCLRKDRKERVGDVSAALFVLRQPPAATPAFSPKRVTPGIRRFSLLAGAGALTCAALAGVAAWKLKPAPATTVTRFVLPVPPGQLLTLTRQSVAISPDGSRVVYSAGGRLYLRSMSSLEPTLIPGTQPGISPVFSPDGQSLLFWGDGHLKQIATTGGTPVTIYRTEWPPAGIAWTRDGIVFAELAGILRLPAHGGKPEVIVKNNPDLMAFAPQLLPGGRALLYATVKRTAAAIDRWDEAQIVVQSLDTGERKTLIERGGHPTYLPTGHILYASGGSMFAVPFALRTLQVMGAALPVLDGVRRGSGQAGAAGLAHFSVSDSGSLVYVPGPTGADQQDLVIFDRKGNTKALGLSAARYEHPRVSPDGRRIAFETNAGKEAVISSYDLSGTSSVQRLTFGGNNRFPVWSNDSKRVAFQSDRDGDPAVFWQAVDGGPAERLTTPERGTSHLPESCSPDGRVLLFSKKKESVHSLWVLSLSGRKEAPFGDVRHSSVPTNATFSPDGGWVAYQTGESGTPQGTTYVQRFPPDGTKHEIAQGVQPLWSRDGRELFFVPGPGQFMAVTVRLQPTFTFTRPSAVPRAFAVAPPANPRPFDSMPDGRFIGVGVTDASPAGPQIHVVLNWFDELKARVPPK